MSSFSSCTSFRQIFPSQPDAILTNTRAAANRNTLLAITSLHDIEEDIWSPTYGLKGKLDASVQAIIAESTVDKYFKQEPLLSTHTMPFEIKTGRSVAGMEHRAQTMLYTLLAEERYGVQVPSGLLYYTQSEEVVRVPRGRNELRGLIGARNEMTAYMMRRMNQGKASEPFLPPTIDDEYTCKKCYALDACMLYRKAGFVGPLVTLTQLTSLAGCGERGRRHFADCGDLRRQDITPDPHSSRFLQTMGSADNSRRTRRRSIPKRALDHDGPCARRKGALF